MNTALMRIVKKSEVVLRQNAPTILTGVGVAGFVATTAFTIRATAKAMDRMPELKKRVLDVKAKAVEEEQSEKVSSQELARVYLSNTVVLGKIYGPTLVMGSASILSVLAGHGMMLRRQATVVAMYAALDSSFRAYRSRVADHIGVEDEKHLYRGNKVTRPEPTEKNPDPGCIIDFSDENPSPYAKFFDESNENWSKDPEYNLFFLSQTERWANDQLRGYGFLYLNDVYKTLGLDRTKAGQMVGWLVRDPEDDGGDNYVSFGIHDLWDENKRAFVNGKETSILLDFNVDGIIEI